jgi:DNA-binding NtrC family response regulator
VDAPALETPAPRSRPRLSFSDSAGQHVIDLTSIRNVGSAPACELLIQDRAVSRLHAVFSPREDGLWVRDLGSRNGTFVGGVKVMEARVPAGASIRLGTTEIAVTYGTPQPPADLWPEASFGTLHARSAAMREVFATVARLAKSDLPVLVVGEQGTGKHELAQAMHDYSVRARQPFVVVDCASLPDPVAAAELLEESLRNAEGGTLVLDEPSELPIELQRELVPPIEAKAFRTIGVSTRDLGPLVSTGAFREALYFRLAGATVYVPPLRERAADLPLLFRHFLGDRADLATPQILEDLARSPWPGNVRELRQYAERLRASGGQWSLVPEPPEPASDAEPIDLGGTMEAPALRATEVAENAARVPADIDFETGFKEFREKWIELGEREYLRRLMLRTNRSSGAASREAGLERTYLYRLLKKHGV